MNSLVKIAMSVGLLGGMAVGLSGVVNADTVGAPNVLHDQVVADTNHVAELQALARAENDQIKIACVNDKMVLLKMQANIADTAFTSLTNTPDDAAARNQLQSSASAVHALRESADGCIGKRVLATDGSSNSFKAPEGVVDPTYENPWEVVFEPPVYASPTEPGVTTRRRR